MGTASPDMADFTVEIVGRAGSRRKRVAARGAAEAVAEALAGLSATEQDGLVSLGVVDGDGDGRRPDEARRADDRVDVPGEAR